MTRDELRAKLPIMQAWVDGKEIEVFSVVHGWVPLIRENMGFAAPATDYRIKKTEEEYNSDAFDILGVVVGPLSCARLNKRMRALINAVKAGEIQ